MAPLPTRKSLESLKRADLQKLCKDYGVRANLKSEALIDLVLDATRQSNPRSSSQSQRSSSTRIAPTHLTGRTRLRSGGSVIIHDTDEQGENVVEEPPPSDTELKHDPPPVPRPTRKAKDTQFRLGVGRPKVVGGAGARVVTKSLSGPKGKRTSKSVKITETSIPEEHESESPKNDHQTPGSSDVGRNNTPIPPPEIQPDIVESQQTRNETTSIPSLNKINDYINELVRPLQQQIQSFKSELERLNAQVAELTEAKTTLIVQLETLRGQPPRVNDYVASVKQNVDASNHISSAATSQLQESSDGNEDKVGSSRHSTQQPSSQGTMFPGDSPTTLGKRPRDSFTSDLTGIIESGAQSGLSEETLAQKVIRPQRKRPKLSKDEDRSRPTIAEASQSAEESSGRAFTVFSGPEECSDYVDPPPPTTHLSDLFGHPPTTPGNDIRTNSANAPENHIPFGMSFSGYQAVTSTPVYATSDLASYLERPESPTSHVIERAGRHDRASPFFLHGGRADQHDRPPSPHQNGEAPELNGDPLSALLKTPPLHAVRDPILAGPNSTAGTGLGMGMPDIRMEDTPAPPVKRTMYGTELEADTRFGDFGVEGIATGYWQGAQRRY